MLSYGQKTITADNLLTFEDAFGVPSLAEALFGCSVSEFETVVAA